MNLKLLYVMFIHIEIWCIVHSARKKELYRALLYNPETEKLDDVINNKKKTNCSPCITACPAESEIDEYFNKNVSFSKNGLFLKDVYKISDRKKVKTEVCENFYEPTMLFDLTTFTYETGYELYYPEGKVDLNCRKYSYDDFLLSFKVPAKLKKTKSPSPKKVFTLSDGRTLVFYWIPVLSLKFNPSKYRIRARFKNDVIHDYRNITIEKCPHYEMGQTIYQSESAKNVDFFNLEKYRFDLFDVLYIPPEIKSDPASNESPYKQSYGGFERAHLVPLMFFHSGAAKGATCTYLNTIPVWTSILRGQLKRIDQYLYTIFRMWSPHVNVVFGVSGLSKVNVSKNWILDKTDFKENNSQTSFTLPFPKLIYRVVEYGTPENMSYAVIVIHNDRTASKNDKICEYTKDDWAFINNDDPKTGISYACPLIPSVNNKLGAYEIGEFPERANSIQLFLMNPEVKSGKRTASDERDRIKKEMIKLFPGQIFPEEEILMNTYDDSSSSWIEDEFEFEETPQKEPRPVYGSKFQKKSKFPYEYPKDGRFWIISLYNF